MDSSEFLNFLATRVSVREYEMDEITEDDAVYLLTAASKAPSAGNLEAWDVVIVTDPGQLEMLTDASGNQLQIKDAGCVFCVCANYVRAMSRYGDRGILFAIEDATIAATYMMLAAHARRLHTCWIGSFDENEVIGILALPAHIRPIVILCVGRGEAPLFGPERMNPENHAHYDIW
ncbi:MAG TPA: nitroreductase family protein [Methanocorpusculum sp.]|nr:nitroreductase family protein [Methanocorpusculum sp.]HJK00748.1 nitroreductase family protein [Methanocorpusculum sp.]